MNNYLKKEINAWKNTLLMTLFLIAAAVFLMLAIGLMQLPKTGLALVILLTIANSYLDYKIRQKPTGNILLASGYLMLIFNFQIIFLVAKINTGAIILPILILSIIGVITLQQAIKRNYKNYVLYNRLIMATILALSALHAINMI